MSREKQSPACLRCVHFHNSPAYLENLYKGLSSLGSAHGSVRKDDGICELREIYLSADQWCDRFQAAAKGGI
jgi:hypothetical protein